MQTEIIFRVKRWGDEVYRSSQTHGHICAFFRDEVLQGYIDSYKPKAVKLTRDNNGDLCWLNEDGSIEPYPEDTDFVHSIHTVVLSQDTISINLQEAKQFYNRQMMVITATYIELIMKDFLQSEFCKFPERMYSYLDDKGMVSLKFITKAESLPNLILELSEQATSNVLKGRFKAQLNSLAKVIPEQELSQNLQNQLIDIIEKRNRIVHEASREQVSDDEVCEALDTCFALLDSLANIAVKCNISLDIPDNVEGFF